MGDQADELSNLASFEKAGAEISVFGENTIAQIFGHGMMEAAPINAPEVAEDRHEDGDNEDNADGFGYAIEVLAGAEFVDSFPYEVGNHRFKRICNQ
jgi:hypothetical protein